MALSNTKREIKTIDMLERERKDRMFWEESKKWSFQDYQEYLKKKRSSFYILAIVLAVFFIGTMAAIILGINLYNFYLDEKYDDLALRTIGEKVCGDINQSLFNVKVYQSGTVEIICEKDIIRMLKNKKEVGL